MLNYLTAITFQNNATTINNGLEYKNSYGGQNAENITFEITGTSTARTLIFEGTSVGGSYYPISCVNLSTLDMNTQTTGNNEVWQADVSGLIGFRVRIASISGGTVNVVGKVVG